MVETEFPSSIEEVPQLLEWFESARWASIPEDLWVQAQTALVEGFTNAVRHAHAALQPSPPVRVRLRRDGTDLLIELEDAGPPFELRAEEPEEGRSSHWGLILLQRLQQRYGWKIRYDALPAGGNILSLRHALDPGVAVKASG